MSLSETVGAAGLSVYAEVALLLFFAAFVGILVQIVSKRSAGDFREASRLPFADTLDRKVSPTPRETLEVPRNGQ